MASTFGWLDTDPAQRRRMLEVVDLFKEEGTVDEIGIGSIRDALSDILFPGTSVLHTRLRYVLFVPWLMQLASQRKNTPAEMSAEFRALEYRMINSLLAGGESTGVFGNRVGQSLKNLPSSAYWGAMSSWGVVSIGSSDAYFRRRHDYRSLHHRTVAADDPESRERMPSAGIDEGLPEPPEDLLKSANFTFGPDEEAYISDRLTSAASGSMLAWLAQRPPSDMDVDSVWHVDNLHAAPEHLRDAVDHARRFSVTIHGAATLYNLLLAEKSENAALTDRYVVALDEWRIEVRASGVLEGWNRGDWWALIQAQNPRLRPMTRAFVDRWLDLLAVTDDVADNPEARDLVATRERQIKGGRARLVNQAALDRWGGGSGMGRHTFRWDVARRHLRDLYSARAA